MNISENGLRFVAQFEGFRPTVYKDVAGYPTIGYGHLIKSGEEFTSITQEEGLQLLSQDIKVAEAGVRRLIQYPVNQNHFDALVSFVYNLGTGALQRSRLRMLLNRGEILEAADQFLRWDRAGGRRIQGLVRRRVAERMLFLTVQKPV